MTHVFHMKCIFTLQEASILPAPKRNMVSQWMLKKKKELSKEIILILQLDLITLTFHSL